MAATMNPTTWASFYKDNKDNGGAVEALFDLSDKTLSVISKGHMDDRSKLIATITGSDGANVLIVPSTDPNVIEWIHQGLAMNLQFGGEMLLAFVHGNLSSSPFKLMDMDSAVSEIKFKTGRGIRKKAQVRSPDPDSYFTIDDEDEFIALPAEDCDILDGHPNHLLVHPSYFLNGAGPKSSRASFLATAIILQLKDQRTASPNNAEIQAEVAKEMEAVSPLLAFLWASAGGHLTHVPLSDPPDNAQLNAKCEQIRSRIRDIPLPPAPQGQPMPPGNPPGGMTNTDTAALALAAQSLTIAMTTSENNRIRERDEDKISKSLISSIGPRQQCLYERLSTESAGDPPQITPFMAGVLKEKSPAKAAHLLMAEMRKWKGGCTEASIHRFLAYGFMAESTSEPGGLSGLIFGKRSLLSSKSTSAASSERQRVMEYFDCDVEASVIENYLKKEYVIPKDAHQLEIAIETWVSFLELVTVSRSIATRGLRRFLEGMEEIYPTIEDMFTTSPDFGLKIMLVLDNHLQNFYDMISEARDVSRLRPTDRRFLVDRADRLLQDLGERVPPRIIVPASLASTGSVAQLPASAKGPAVKTTPAKKDRDPREKSGNKEITLAPIWAIPSGKTYEDFFPRGSPNLTGWPTFPDSRHGRRLATMCVRYQVEGNCTNRCPGSHFAKSDMAQQDKAKVTAKFRAIFGS